MGTTMTDQSHWINTLKSNCNFCHQLGNALTRDVTHVEKAHPDAKTTIEAWEWRLGTGVRGNSMYSALVQMGKEPSLKTFADWTDRVAKGGVPPAPPRPKASSEMLSSRCGMWATITPSCTIRSRRTNSIRT